MATYAIGDVQGCYDELQTLLKVIAFDEKRDQLWFVGDLVNRGPKSLEVLRFIKNLDNAVVVLGNHDIHLLALAYGASYSPHTLEAVLTAPDRDELIDWVRQLPLLHHDPHLDYVMVHAGILPQWDLVQAKQYAKEVETALRSGNNLSELLANLYGDSPDQWSEDLKGFPRLRFITNVFTRMRFCDMNGILEFRSMGPIGSQPENFFPWFKIPDRHMKEFPIVFGHWAALNGLVEERNVYALDTGCAWGRSLTAMRLQDRQRFSVPCLLRSSITKL